MTDVRIRDKARGHTFAELVAPGGINDQLVYAEVAVDALFALGEGLFEPLAVNVEFACCDTEFNYPLIEPQPAAPFQQLRLAASPDAVEIPEIWEGQVVARSERLDRAAVLDWFATLLAEQQCPQPDTRTGWTEMIVDAVRARLPEATSRRVDSDSAELPVFYGSWEIRYPVERLGDAFWAAGPLAWNSDTAPFEVRITNEAGVLSLDWSRNWSPWIEANGAGRPDVEAVVQRLSALGWEVQPHST
jgi:hypothetical protein